MLKVLIIANAKKTKGGITSVLNTWEKMPFWKKYHCRWVETQINSSIWKKLYYLISSYIKSVFLIPSYNIIHFHTTPGISTIVQMPIFLLSIIFRKKIIIQLHVGNQLIDFKDSRTFRFVLKHADKTIVLANVWKNVLINNFKEAHSVHVLYNPAPCVKVTSNEKRDNLVFYGAYLADNKGYDILIKAFSKVAKVHPNWKLLIAAAGDTGKAEIIIKECKAENNIDLVQWLTPQQMEEQYARAKIYCIASYKEGFPMSALECWSHGTPLVTTPVGGLVDVIKNRENAMVFSFGSEDELEKCLLDLIDDEELWHRLSVGSTQLVREFFGQNRINVDIENIYESL